MRAFILCICIIFMPISQVCAQVFVHFPEISGLTTKAAGKIKQISYYNNKKQCFTRIEHYDLHGKIIKIETISSCGDVYFTDYMWKDDQLYRIIFGEYGWVDGKRDYTKKYIEKEIIINESDSRIVIEIVFGKNKINGEGVVEKKSGKTIYHVEYSDGLVEDIEIENYPDYFKLQYKARRDKEHINIVRSLARLNNYIEYVDSDFFSGNEFITTIRIDNNKVTSMRYKNRKVMSEDISFQMLDNTGNWIGKYADAAKQQLLVSRLIEYW